MKTVQIEIVGTSPLLIHRFGEEAEQRGRMQGLDSSQQPPPPNGLRRINGVVAAPEGRVLLQDGRVVPVLGTLLMTADECVIGVGNVNLHHVPAGSTHRTLMVTVDSNGKMDEAYGIFLFSSPERRDAALAAKEAKQ